MKMKKALVYLLMALPMVLTTSCLKDQEDTFPTSAAQRMQSYLAEAKSVLISSEYGWAMKYYPDRNQSYGGYNFTVRFSEDSVWVGTELADDITVIESSLYKVSTDDGPILSFDTFNPYMHFFATPSGSQYEAYDGDFELIIMDISADKNTVTLKGKRSGCIIEMNRLTTDAVTYLQTVQDVENNMPFSNFIVVNGTDTTSVSLSSGSAKVSFGEEDPQTTAYIYTPEGVEFYSPVTIFGQEVTGIRYAADSDTFGALNNANVIFEAVIVPLNEQFVTKDWYIAYSLLGAYAQPLWDQAKAGSASEGEVISVAAFTIDAPGFGIFLASGNYGCFYHFEYELTGDDEITMYYKNLGSGTYESNANWYINNAGHSGIVKTFGENADNPRTFKLTTDRVANPSYITLTDQNEPTNVITVVARAVSNPFDN